MKRAKMTFTPQRRKQKTRLTKLAMAAERKRIIREACRRCGIDPATITRFNVPDDYQDATDIAEAKRLSEMDDDQCSGG